jgi:hypothetical protein
MWNKKLPHWWNSGCPHSGDWQSYQHSCHQQFCLCQQTDKVCCIFYLYIPYSKFDNLSNIFGQIYKSSFIFSGKPLYSTAVRHVGQISSVNPGLFTDLAPLHSSASSTMNLLSKEITSLVSNV